MTGTGASFRQARATGAANGESRRRPEGNRSTARHDAWHHGPGSNWQLLLALLAGGEDESVRRVAEAVEEVGLEPAQKERIARSVDAMLRDARQRDVRGRLGRWVSIRVWISGPAGAAAGTDADAGDDGGKPSRGWGFFLLERQQDPSPDVETEPHRLVELYLYQEAAHTR
jgi:hypothetical protein